MPFQPIITIVEVPRNSTYVTIKDDTEAYHVTDNPTGWGAPGGPADSGDLTSVLMIIQFYGSTPTQLAASALSGNIDDGLKGTYTLTDGVYLVYGLYGMSTDEDYTINTGRESITALVTLNDFDEEWGNINYIEFPADPEVLYKIKSKDRTTGVIELYSALDDVVDTTGLTKYYSGLKRILVLNCGEGSVIKDISNMSLAECGCDTGTTIELMKRIQLKLAAQVAFSCGNYAKAHNAAVLLCDKQAIHTPCTTC